MKSKRNRQESLDMLKRRGMSEEKAIHFLDHKVGIVQLHIPGLYLEDILRELGSEGLPVATAAVSFMIPADQLEAFQAKGQAAIEKLGGTFFRSAEEALLVRSTPDTRH